MPLYYPITIVRSDGLFAVPTRSGTSEPNEPTAAQQDDTPDSKGMVDCYKRLDPEEPKAVDWRRKLGGMLMHRLGGKEHLNKSYILAEIPEGYVLWEHLKYNVDKVNGDKSKEKGKHAAGVFERQDAYLYGHPQGRKKRYRSPADFFHHLLWLAVDKEGDPRNCSCKICSPDEVAEESVKATSQLKNEIKPVPAPTTSAVTIKPLPQSQSTPAASKPPPNNIQKATSQPNPTASTFISAEQRADGAANGQYLYRSGELVWFNNGLNWRLGIISRRQIQNNKPRYLLQPLSNPYQHQPWQIKDDEASIRPWLAWSVPLTTVPAIQELTYDQVPWERVLRGELDAGHSRDYVVDGSILAAKVVDSSYSLYDRIENALAGPGEVHYRGMFLGAEKIWVGEPIRLRGSDSKDIVVLIVHKLIERTTPQGISSVTFVGDVYKWVEMPTPYRNRADWPTPDLPARMVADLRFRNEVADQAGTGIYCEWRLLEPAVRKSLTDVKGRWYETRTLLPILRGAAAFQAELVKGRTHDAGQFMNGRRDKNNNVETRKKNRRDTLGRAVPADFKVSRGLDGPEADLAFPDIQQPPPAAAELTPYVESDIDQFMDLDQAATGGHHEFYGGV
ncbi:hypothetical protein HYALB_00001853 [Hymenoscyphus albidus]|uniref:Cryptic loci regulator 2 N-terminal domain-containing protein n=1 Tax=Hymenoscyphus albidus TaxID=595503 RepID=A0A9N9Q805_9HELO|nr:hypothetical protein HYALB_00001853 [Hymenoscyphus albidus]